MDPGIKAGDSASQAQASAPGPDVDLTGKTLGDFQLLRRLGQGGMGQVYLAEQVSLKRKVALKLLKPELASNHVSLQRFKIEALSVARATHANIVQVYVVDEADGHHFMALEYVEGRNLREYLEKKGTTEIHFGLKIMWQVASALQRASELGIIHRDIKPENILLTRKGDVKVADFGLSRSSDNFQSPSLTQTDVAMGTPLYMSPEQVQGKRDLDHRTDIYSLGATCYHMFAGQPPFRGTSPYDVANQHINKEPPPLTEVRPDLPAELCAIIHKMMAKTPEQRYQSGREIVRDVSNLRDALVSGTQPLAPVSFALSGVMETQTAPPPSAPQRAGRSWRWLWLGLPAALVAGVFVGWLLKGGAAPNGNGSNGDPGGEIGAAEEREKDYVKQLQQYARLEKPDFLDITTGLNFATKLGLLYLNQRRLDEADSLFKDLAADKHSAPMRQLGKLGRAMALAFRDQPDESNKLFEKLLTDKEKFAGAGGANLIWRNNPALREMMARALHHNYVNSPATFPKQLERFRFPPPPNIK
ncbi:MAG: protein kinase [Gemmataceae bacterium]|nr:protein kinase [Gemmataceae bacterium]